MCPVCLGLRCHVPGCPEAWTEPDPEEETVYYSPPQIAVFNPDGSPLKVAAHFLTNGKDCCLNLTNSATDLSLHADNRASLLRLLDEARAAVVAMQPDPLEPEEVPFEEMSQETQQAAKEYADSIKDVPY